MNLLAKQKESHRLRKWTHGGKGMAGDFRKVMNTLLCLEWITKRNLLLQHMELCSVLCVRLDGRGVWGRMDTCICMAESLHCLPETITTLLISYTPMQNKQKRLELWLLGKESKKDSKIESPIWYDPLCVDHLIVLSLFLSCPLPH